jgi:uncharacterized membrane protein
MSPATGEAGMGYVDESIDVGVDAPVAYALWLDYEGYPRFMGEIQRVEVIGFCHLRWTGLVCDRTDSWETHVVDRVEDTRVRWEAGDGRETGEVTLEKHDAGTTRVHYKLEYDAAVWHGRDPAAVRACLHARVRDDLQAFKTFAEALQEVDEGST